jgi:hypothetical protein
LAGCAEPPAVSAKVVVLRCVQDRGWHRGGVRRGGVCCLLLLVLCHQ